jgi:hypothetical protein
MAAIPYTRARRDLLQAIADGKVVIDVLSAERPIYWDMRAVSARARVFIREGWAKVEPREADRRSADLALTEAGQLALRRWTEW